MLHIILYGLVTHFVAYLFLAGSIDVQIHHWDFKWEWALDVVGELKKHDGYCTVSIWHLIKITCINWIYKGIWLWVMINESDLDLHAGVFPYWPLTLLERVEKKLNTVKEWRGKLTWILKMFFFYHLHKHKVIHLGFLEPSWDVGDSI